VVVLHNVELLAARLRAAYLVVEAWVRDPYSLR